MFHIMSDGKKSVTIEDVRGFLDNQLAKLRPFVKEFGSIDLINLFSDDVKKRNEAFAKIDHTEAKDSKITLEEWITYLKAVQVERFKHFRKMFLINDHKYGGLGLEPGEPYNSWVVDKLQVTAYIYLIIALHATNNQQMSRNY